MGMMDDRHQNGLRHKLEMTGETITAIASDDTETSVVALVDRDQYGEDEQRGGGVTRKTLAVVILNDATDGLTSVTGARFRVDGEVYKVSRGVTRRGMWWMTLVHDARGSYRKAGQFNEN